MGFIVVAACLGVCAILLCRLFVVPHDLRHLPRVPVLPLLWSYSRGEPEDKRLRRLVLPFANEMGEEIVLVWALGRWMVHILDHKVGYDVFANIDLFPKEDPPDDLLLWRFIGRNNILLSNGEQWRRHSKVIRNAINQSIPVPQFASLSRRLFSVIGGGQSTQHFDDLAQRFALDAVGTTAFGYDFDAIAHDSPFVRNYNTIMHAIANPLYLIMPFLERVVPRHSLKKRMDILAERFGEILVEKRETPGPDMLTNMLQDVHLTDGELRDNMLLLFIAGHDTSAGGIASLMYFLAKHDELQTQARKEVVDVLGTTDCPTVENVQRMPFLMSCVREALRINTPIAYVVPRSASMPIQLGRYTIPANTSIVLNIYAVHHNERDWPAPFDFDPNRFQNISTVGAAWIPFGLGPRQCPAKAFALHEQMVLTAMMLREYKWSLPASSVHADDVQNAFSPFALCLPHRLDLVCTRIETP
ncbi:cytochrome P450 [Irpex rosettiformis]|uniref:Cytochrome P450 n=1 Tax=Irpex rosettiformis TaxID=378272 RepID=A0ACB8TM76_9APHY|nr:cytochrome P450 [Irpex rosettiformis]